jgi:hypothetical protein
MNTPNSAATDWLIFNSECAISLPTKITGRVFLNATPVITILDYCTSYVWITDVAPLKEQNVEIRLFKSLFHLSHSTLAQRQLYSVQVLPRTVRQSVTSVWHTRSSTRQSSPTLGLRLPVDVADDETGIGLVEQGSGVHPCATHFTMPPACRSASG